VRAGELTGPTNGLAPGYVQCNLMILGQAQASAFTDWCTANHKACPVLAVSDAGDPHLPKLGVDLDLRTDLPSYRVFRDGEIAGDVPDIHDLWQDDLVAFAFGCSFSFEDALRVQGVALDYRDRGDVEALYLSALQTQPVGPFRGPVAVSMRPLSPAAALRAYGVTGKYPGVHGAPVHMGRPSAIGVDLADPLDTIGRTRVLPGELPVFWACGVTPQLAMTHARLPLAITHTSAHMLITDLQLADLSSGDLRRV
jgi:uncharacterized protein YcsI (UPF0317 family)